MSIGTLSGFRLTAKRLLVKFPKLYRVAKSAALLFSGLVFRYRMATNKPYLGLYYCSVQLWPEREPFMRRLVERVAAEQQGLTMLEIGSWAGASALLWAETAKRVLGEKDNPALRILCVDIWRYYSGLDTRTDAYMSERVKASQDEKIFSLFLHNIRTAGHSDCIIPMRTSSRTAAQFLGDDRFDLVFIDGDHAYSSVKLDIEEYVHFVKDGGYICGDDLELQMSEIDASHARQRQEDEFAQDPKTGKEFHPGVSLAVDEFFGDVSAYAGFWVMQKQGETWQKVTL